MQNVRYDWLEQKMMADEFKQKLMDLGEEDFVMYIIQEAKKTVELVKGKDEEIFNCHELYKRHNASIERKKKW